MDLKREYFCGQCDREFYFLVLKCPQCESPDIRDISPTSEDEAGQTTAELPEDPYKDKDAVREAHKDAFRSSWVGPDRDLRGILLALLAAGAAFLFTGIFASVIVPPGGGDGWQSGLVGILMVVAGGYVLGKCWPKSKSRRNRS